MRIKKNSKQLLWMLKGEKSLICYQTVVRKRSRNTLSSVIQLMFKSVMDLSKAFKGAVRRQLGNPLIIADQFHFMRQAY
ncbi:transposase [Alkalihalobacterium alkalinitrilicum]|uniref:transposase n=1 Tax=Alkalihalobacterium alkalinitrilicum TaxID=427920 RepID=UPI001150E7F6|nr:transposase [Alkalihalobacterium alkalinitrilicum]